ncbi:MAG: hypothetical protein NC212_08560 [Staphylococcus sp.]|nr:hypothetical protein [Staphylococcus sp.]
MKLKEPPYNIIVHTSTETEAKELLTILYENGWDVREPLDHVISEADGISIYPKPHWGWWENINNAKLNGDNILTLAEFKSKYVIEEEKPQPKFKVGDMAMFPMSNTPMCINDIADGVAMSWWDDGGIRAAARLEDLKPYTEPETKSTEDMETKELNRCEKCGANTQQCMDAPCQNYLVEKKLNLCELLEGHTDELFYSPYFGEIEVSIDFCDAFPIIVNGEHLTNDGRLYLNDDCMPSIFPSRALYEQYPLDPYTAWMKWQEGQKKFALDVNFRTYDTPDFGEVLYFRTPADRDKCIEVIGAFLSQSQQSKSVASLCEEIKAIIDKYSK